MTEFNFKFSSTNLLEIGPVIEVEVGVPLPLLSYLQEQQLPPRSVRAGFALIDTGCYATAVDETIFEDLGIPPVGSVPTTTPHGLGASNIFKASVSLPALEIFNRPIDPVIGCHIRNQAELGLDLIMLIGRDFLRDFVFIYDGPASSVSIRR